MALSRLKMRIKVNGEERECEEGIVVTRLLEILSIASSKVVVELNMEVLSKGRLSDTRLKEGDQVEIVHFVGGGVK